MHFGSLMQLLPHEFVYANAWAVVLLRFSRWIFMS